MKSSYSLLVRLYAAVTGRPLILETATSELRDLAGIDDALGEASFDVLDRVLRGGVLSEAELHAVRSTCESVLAALSVSERVRRDLLGAIVLAALLLGECNVRRPWGMSEIWFQYVFSCSLLWREYATDDDFFEFFAHVMNGLNTIAGTSE